MTNYERKSVPAGFTEITSGLLSTNNGTTTDSYELQDGEQVVKHELVWTATKATYKCFKKPEGDWVMSGNPKDLVEGCFYNTDASGKVNWGYCDTSAIKITQAYVDANSGVTETSTDQNGHDWKIDIKNGAPMLCEFNGVDCKSEWGIPIDSYVENEDGAMFVLDPVDFEDKYQIKV